MYRSLERTICYGFIINDCSPVASFGRTITFVAWTMWQIPKKWLFLPDSKKEGRMFTFATECNNVKAYSAFSSDGSDYYSSFVLLLHWITPKAIMRKSDGSN